VVVTSPAGRLSVQQVVARPAAVFHPPGRETKGAEAFARIKRYFVDSRFTNCAEGWPACPTEQRYAHCAGGGIDGRWYATSFPPSLTSASSGSYHVLNASQRADGSWGITYQVIAPSGSLTYYTWTVSPDGVAHGGYANAEDAGILQGYVWQQPAGCPEP
jgi:hypothetical protein